MQRNRGTRIDWVAESRSLLADLADGAGNPRLVAGFSASPGTRSPRPGKDGTGRSHARSERSAVGNAGAIAA